MDTIAEQLIDVPAAATGSCRISVLRLDLIDKDISGNKWFKLIFNLEQAKKQGFHSILTFGGPWSNHLVATAVAASRAGLGSTGFVRGAIEWHQLTDTLSQCRDAGMQLHSMTRSAYSNKDDKDFLSGLRSEFPGHYIIPEGGANRLGREGAGLIAKLISADTDVVCLPVGTGTTFAGIRAMLPLHIRMIGFAPMKGGRYLEKNIRNWLPEYADHNWLITDEYHFGGFGKITPALTAFMSSFYRDYNIMSDRVYTGKMFAGIFDLLEQKHFSPGSKICCLHTGGIQGNRSINFL